MISAIISTMNRTDRLITILPSWASFKCIKEIVIVDWSSRQEVINNEEIKDLIQTYPKIKIIRIDNQEYFHLPKAYNLAFKFTNPEYPFILKIDVDYLNINQSTWLEDLLPLINNENYINGFNNIGDRSVIRTEPYGFKRCLSGFLLIHKSNFGKGYKENLEYACGANDLEFYERIEKNINKLLFLDLSKYVYHIPHTDKTRTENYKIKDLKEARKLNHQIKKQSIDWIPQEYKVLENTKNYIKVN